MGQAFDVMVECATIIDDSQTWRVVYGNGHYEDGNYELHVVSKGAIPRLPGTVFGDISDCVVIEVDPEDDSHTTVHFAKYIGGVAGMQMFAHILATDLNQGAEGDVNPISNFVSRNPLWLINAITRSHD